jgi:hypothetical protein
MIRWLLSFGNRIACLIAIGMSIFLPQSTYAEPIQWSLKTTILTDNGASWIDIGPVTLGQESPSGEVTLTPSHAYGGVPSGGGEQDFEGSQLGANTIRIATLSNQSFDFLSTPPVPVAPNFRVRLEVTDLASEEQGVLEFTAGLSLDGGEVIWLNQPHLVDITIPSGNHLGSLDLGGNRYSFDVRSGSTESNAILEAEVTVSPLVQTPEPSTLVLAGLGFSAFAFRKRRRQELI